MTTRRIAAWHRMLFTAATNSSAAHAALCSLRLLTRRTIVTMGTVVEAVTARHVVTASQRVTSGGEQAYHQNLCARLDYGVRHSHSQNHESLF